MKSDMVAAWNRDMAAWRLRVAAWLALDPTELTDIDVEQGPPAAVTWTSWGRELRAAMGRQESPQVLLTGDDPVRFRSTLYLDEEHASQLTMAAGARPEFPDLRLPDAFRM